ncbi:MAG: hypothetical protein ACYTDX_00025 [Planctomycetota bacterium]|jgi:hypothetical protein
MPLARNLLLAVAALVASGCAVFDSGTTVTGEIVLSPGGTAQGTMVAVGGSSSSIALENRGPGTVEVRVRQEEGRILLDGPLGVSETEVFDSQGDVVLDVLLRNTGDRRSSVRYTVRGADGSGVDWTIIDGSGKRVLDTSE